MTRSCASSAMIGVCFSLDNNGDQRHRKIVSSGYCVVYIHSARNHASASMPNVSRWKRRARFDSRSQSVSCIVIRVITAWFIVHKRDRGFSLGSANLSNSIALCSNMVIQIAAVWKRNCGNYICIIAKITPKRAARFYMSLLHAFARSASAFHPTQGFNRKYRELIHN